MDRLSPASSVLLLIDVQERLAAAVPEEATARLVRNAGILLEGASQTHVPIVASEQYPKGLGPTVAPLLEKLRALSVSPIDKLTFDAASEPRLARALEATGARSVVVAGLETHICVFQTARELVRRGYATYVVADACASRIEENRQAGLTLCTRAGAVVTVTEAVAFDWVERAGTDAFKAVSKLVR